MKKMKLGRIKNEERRILDDEVTKFIPVIQKNLDNNEDLEPAVIGFISQLRTALETLHGGKQ
ncbi:MAG: hypothetical protein PHZ00_04665 [Candidatus Peribacteraceae bacterium]|nr:hypothetical protein [Candidatus Peribacteraceae bacterium]